MPCVGADGSLTPIAERVLRVIEQQPAATVDSVVRAAGLPAYRARSTLRELCVAGLVAEAAGEYRLASSGIVALRRAEDARPS